MVREKNSMFHRKKYIRFHDKHHQQIQCKKCIDCHGKNRRLLSWKSMHMTYIDLNDKIKNELKLTMGGGGGGGRGGGRGRPINAWRSRSSLYRDDLSTIKAVRSRSWLYQDHLPTIKVMRNQVYMKAAADDDQFLT